MQYLNEFIYFFIFKLENRRSVYQLSLNEIFKCVGSIINKMRKKQFNNYEIGTSCSNACHESELFITVLLRVFPEILVKSINYIHAHTRTHAYEQSYLAFNFVSLLLSIHVHVCTDARKQNVRNPFDVEQNTLWIRCIEFIDARWRHCSNRSFSISSALPPVEIFVSLFSRIIVIVESTRLLVRCEEFKRYKSFKEWENCWWRAKDGSGPTFRFVYVCIYRKHKSERIRPWDQYR